MADDRIHLLCARCGATLTHGCTLGTMDSYDKKAASTSPSVPRGMIIIIPFDDTLFIESAKGKVTRHKTSSMRAFAVNPNDVLREHIHSTGVDNGCCGSDGLDGFNRKCSCGKVLGTEWSDCWTQAEVRFEPDAVRLANV